LGGAAVVLQGAEAGIDVTQVRRIERAGLAASVADKIVAVRAEISGDIGTGIPGDDRVPRGYWSDSVNVNTAAGVVGDGAVIDGKYSSIVHDAAV